MVQAKRKARLRAMPYAWLDASILQFIELNIWMLEELHAYRMVNPDGYGQAYTTLLTVCGSLGEAAKRCHAAMQKQAKEQIEREDQAWQASLRVLEGRTPHIK